MNALNKIANYFREWNGEDEKVANIKLSTDDLRFIANLNVEKCRFQTQARILDYLLRKNPEYYSKLIDEMAMDR